MKNEEQLALIEVGAELFIESEKASVLIARLRPYFPAMTGQDQSKWGFTDDSQHRRDLNKSDHHLQKD